MLRNVSGQRWRCFAWDATTGLAKTGDAANISAYIQKDDAAGAATNDAAPTEVDATNQPGYYDFDLTQAETSAAKLSLSPKSSTPNIQVVACPPVVYTRPQYFSQQAIDSDGVADADVQKILSDAQSATDLKDFADAGYDPSTNKVSGVVLVDTLTTWTGATPPTGDTYAIVNSGTHGNAALKTLIDAVDNFVDTEIAAIQTVVNSTNLQVGDIAGWSENAEANTSAIISTLGTPAGASLAADLVVIDDFVDALESRLTAARAGYLDNINNANLASVPAFPSNFSSLAINASGHVSRVTLTDTTTTNTDMITAAGIRSAVGLNSANLDTQLAAIDDYLDTEVAAVLAAVDTEVAAIVSALGTPSNLGGGATIAANLSDIESQTDDIGVAGAGLTAIWTGALTESYRSHQATGSPAQLLYELIAHHGASVNSGTTKQTKRLDGTTNAKSYSYNSAGTPTSLLHAS